MQQWWLTCQCFISMANHGLQRCHLQSPVKLEVTMKIWLWPSLDALFRSVKTVHIEQLKRPQTERSILNNLFTKIAERNIWILSIPGTYTNIETVKYIRLYSVALCYTKKRKCPVEIWQQQTQRSYIRTHQRTEGLSRFKGTNLHKINTIKSNIHPDSAASDLC